MVVRTGRKVTGGRIRPHRKVKRRYERTRPFLGVFVSEKEERVKIRVRGGNYKIRCKAVKYVNLAIPSEGKCVKTEILGIDDNPANREFIRRGIITKGAIIRTKYGLARVVSRPTQDGVVNAVLMEKAK
ncbi:30S ribosomal protein S8e [archaeon]|nr:MAG: 30S ribosomal protein S8e [archaeon]RLG65764.1 MAG: 30S ribosomal protein S8e [archaeon]RLG66004.1 MAG: 30S ribosomal protein S8e [archaeon]HDM23982.1 30S ribosomal protein S8e [Candidatus Bathyarchaeota archaeon]